MTELVKVTALTQHKNGGTTFIRNVETNFCKSTYCNKPADCHWTTLSTKAWQYICVIHLWLPQQPILMLGLPNVT